MPNWSTVEETMEATLLSRSSLQNLKNNGFTPGVHWVYLTGGKNGSVGWDVEAIKQWQIERTQQVAVDRLTKDVETYLEGNTNG